MEQPPCLDHLSADEIAAALNATASELSPDQVLTLHDFISRVGGIQNAALAVKMLGQMERAA